jgi:hypothetical protein
MKEASNPLDNILAIFADIDERIIFLHQCSSDDLLSHNRNLKENYKKSSFITEQASNIFEKIGDEGNLKTLGLLRKNFEIFQQELQEFKNETDQTLASLDRIQANFSLMFVPINNFRQNLVSLKLLLSNIKLTNTYFDKSIKSFNESEAIQIDSIINKVKDSCPVFEENIYNIQKHIKKLYHELSAVNNEMTIENGSFNEKFRRFAYHSKKSLDKYVHLAKEISMVSKIVTNLYHKYQDIDMMDNAIEQRIIDKINFGDLLISPERETASQAQQILKLYADNHFEKNKIKILFESTRVELKEFICRNMDFMGDKKGIERMNARIEDAIEYFETIKENLTCIEGLQTELAGQNKI